MERMTGNDANVLARMDDETRAGILFQYLVEGQSMTDIAADVLRNYDSFASQTVSVVTRSYGFLNGQGRGQYRSVPYHIIEEFVNEYQPENHDGGLDQGTFDEFLEEYFSESVQEAQLRTAQQEAEKQRRKREERK